MDPVGAVEHELSFDSHLFDSTGFRNALPRFTPEARQANQALVDLLGKIGQRKKATS